MGFNQYVVFLSGLYYFKSIPKNDINMWFVNNRCTVSSFEKGEIIHMQHDVCSSMDIIISGMVSIQKIDEYGNVLTITNLLRNDMFGGNLLFSENNTYSMTSTCFNDCVLISLTKELILDLCQRHVEFLHLFLELLSNKTLLVTNVLHALTHKSIREMLIDYLKAEYGKQKILRLKLSITKQALAEKFGVQRPSLSRELKKMRDEGLVEYDAKSITLNSIDVIKG